jgi:hypothetical protein
MKLMVIVLNLVSAVGFVVIGSAAAAIHSAHSNSTYHEFVVIGAIDEQELETLTNPDRPEETGYDLQAKMQQAGNVEAWLTRISWLAAAACVLNAVSIQILMKKHKQPDVGSLG